MKEFPPLGYTGNELNAIFNLIELIETENFVQHEFLCPNMLEDEIKIES